MTWRIQKEQGYTDCDNPHPVRLGRNAQHYGTEPHERRWAIDTGQKGYLCPGGEEHLYDLWVVYNEDTDEQEAFDVYKEAVAFRDRMVKEDAGVTGSL